MAHGSTEGLTGTACGHDLVRLEPLSESRVSRYLRLLGVEKGGADRELLDQLVRAHATRVPFESISKLHYFRTLGLTEIPDIDLYLEGIEQYSFGGTCYANNAHFCRLLQTLGFEASLCGADMGSGEDVHAAIVVRAGGRDLLIDAGYAAPFLVPIPLNENADVVVRFGRDRYVLSPRDEWSRSRLDLYREGELIHGYLLKPHPRPVVHFDAVVRRSFRAEATFMNAVMLVRYTADASIAIHNLSVVRSTATAFHLERLTDREDLVRAIVSEFGMPESVTREVVAHVPMTGDPYR